MIDWLVQTTTAHAGLAKGAPPAGLMNAAELARFSHLHCEKRRGDRLLGRWTCKRLLQYVVNREEGQLIPLAQLEIDNDAAGAPRLLCDRTRSAYSISISHAKENAFCAVVAGTGLRLGADIEFVETRATSFVVDYFTPEEQAVVARSPVAMRSTAVTAIWSAKEAVLKALGVGLRQDTRNVHCAIEPVIEAPGDWTAFSAGLTDGRVLAGWWRGWSGYVLSLAIQEV